ncbi:hypothetical protein LUZ60_006673 [Juncus effusus]|nr:hypothetical protein LUZ60_006673 [Juncus effusus]
MVLFRKILSIDLGFAWGRRNRGGVFLNVCNGFCSSVQSPELPDWFKNPKENDSNSSLNLNSDDEFVLPTKLEFSEGINKSTETSSNNKRNISWAGTVYFYDKTNDSEVEINQIIHNLKPNFTSPESVIVSLNNCSVMVSNCLVEKILVRFNNDWIRAFGFFMWADSQPDFNHSPESYNAMIDVLGKFKQFDLMWGLIRKMSQIGGLISLETMKKVMRRLAGAGQWVETVSVFKEIEKFGVKRNISALNALLDTLCKERSVRRAHEVFDEMSELIPPNETSFNSLIHGWCKARKIDKARETMKEMRELGFKPCVITYTSLIEAYCLEKDFVTVDLILKEMRNDGCAPNVVTYTIIMHSLGKVGKIKEALGIFERMKKENIELDASCYNSLIYLHGRAGKLNDAQNLFDEMCERGITPNLNTFNTLISILCDYDLIGDALELLVKMERENQIKPNTKTYIPLLKICCKNRWVKILNFLLGQMFRRDISLDLGTYTLMINGLCRNGKLVQSCLFFEGMVLKGFIPKDETYNNLIKGLETRQMYEAKRKVNELMEYSQRFRWSNRHTRVRVSE